MKETQVPVLGSEEAAMNLRESERRWNKGAGLGSGLAGRNKNDWL
jgi:hypothetical protein